MLDRLNDYKIERAMELARQLEGWDIFATSREQNIFYTEEDLRTVAARFWTLEQAHEWSLSIGADDTTINRHFDERFNMPCYIVVATYHYE